MPLKKWSGTLPRACSICGGTFGKVFYDAATRMGWGIVCHSCFKSHGHGLGVGRGQKYSTKTLEFIDG